MRVFHSESSSERQLLWILLAAAILRLGAIIFFHPPLLSDSKEYHDIAQSVVHGEGFTIDGKPTAFRLPGYPIILAATYFIFGYSRIPIALVQLLADLASCVLVFAIGRKLISEKVGIVAAWIFALFPIQILYVPHVMTETLFTTIFLATIWLSLQDYLTAKKSVVIGLLVGAGILIRSTALILPLVIYIHRWKGGEEAKKGLRSLSIIGIMALLVVSPWLIRNLVQFERFSLTSNGGVNFWMGSHAGATGSYSYPQNNPLTTVQNEFERSDLGVRLGLEFIRSHPFEYAEVVAKKFVRFFSPDYWLMMTLEYKPEWAFAPNASTIFSQFSPFDILLLHLPYAAVLFMGVFGLVCGRPEDERGEFLFRLLILSWLLVHLVVVADARYRFPIMPVFFLSAAYCREMLRTGTLRRSTLRLAVASTLCLVLVGGWLSEYMFIRARAVPSVVLDHSSFSRAHVFLPPKQAPELEFGPKIR